MKFYGWIFCLCLCFSTAGCWNQTTLSQLERSCNIPSTHSEILFHTPLQQSFLHTNLGNRAGAIVFFPWYLMQQANTLELGDRQDPSRTSRPMLVAEREEEIAEELLKTPGELNRSLALEILDAQAQEVPPDFWKSLKQQPTYVKIVTLHRFASDPKYLHYILPLLEDPHELVRLAALQNLARIRSSAALPYLYRLLLDESGTVRSQTIKQLGEMGFWESIPYLWPMLDDPEPSVRRVARQSLERLTGHPAGYQDQDSPTQRQDAIRHWRSWWEHTHHLNP